MKTVISFRPGVNIKQTVEPQIKSGKVKFSK